MAKLLTNNRTLLLVLLAVAFLALILPWQRFSHVTVLIILIILFLTNSSMRVLTAISEAKSVKNKLLTGLLGNLLLNVLFLAALIYTVVNL